MSVRIKRNELTQDHIKTIRSGLFFQPASGYFSKNKFFSTPVDPILLWALDKPNGEVILPYSFANNMLKRNINFSKKYPPGSFKFIGSLRDYQMPIVKEANRQLDTNGTTTLNIYPGAGKTIMATYLSSLKGGLVLILYPIKIVETSWINTVKKFTNASIWINNGKNPVPSSCNIILSMDTQFHKIPKEILKMVSTLIIDESHMFCVPSRIGPLLGTSPKYIIACTATVKRTDKMESIMYAVCGTNGVHLKNPNKITVYKFSTGIKTKLEIRKTGGVDWQDLVTKLCFNKERNEMIVNFIERNPRHKIIVLTWNKGHAKLIYELLKAKNISVDYLVGTKNKYKNSRILVGTMSKIGTGFDEAMTCPDWDGKHSNMVMLTGSTKSFPVVEQTKGRIRDKNPIVIDFVDDNKISNNHWKQRLKVYENEINCEIKYINMVRKEEPEDKLDNDKIAKIQKNRLGKIKQKQLLKNSKTRTAK